jgi:hypothetical protein
LLKINPIDDESRTFAQDIANNLTKEKKDALCILIRERSPLLLLLTQDEGVEFVENHSD